MPAPIRLWQESNYVDFVPNSSRCDRPATGKAEARCYAGKPGHGAIQVMILARRGEVDLEGEFARGRCGRGVDRCEPDPRRRHAAEGAAGSCALELERLLYRRPCRLRLGRRRHHGRQRSVLLRQVPELRRARLRCQGLSRRLARRRELAGPVHRRWARDRPFADRYPGLVVRVRRRRSPTARRSAMGRPPIPDGSTCSAPPARGSAIWCGRRSSSTAPAASLGRATSTTTDLVDSRFFLPPFAPDTDGHFASTSTPTWRFGWVAGIGGEARVFDSNWLARLEYLHYDFGHSGSSVAPDPLIHR